MILTSSCSGDDGGYTTEEDLPAAAKFAPPRSVLRRAPDADGSDESHDSDTSVEEVVIQRRGPVRSRGPRLGQWIHDISRGFATLDKDTNQIIMFRGNPSSNRGSIDNGQELGLGQRFTADQGLLPYAAVPTGVLDSANVMISAMNTPFNHRRLGPAMGPPEAFYSWTFMDADGNIHENSLSDDDDLESDLYADDPVDLDDFLNLGEEVTDDDTPINDAEQSSDSPATAGEPSSTPARPTTLSSEDQVHPLLDHFAPGVVGAFRKHQDAHNLLNRGTESAESLAFQGTRTIRGIKQGRLTDATAPITPLRKHKSQRSIVGPLDSSPLAFTGGGIEDKKRKFDMEDAVRGHKRSKSLI